MVPGAGLEPARCCHRGILSPIRLLDSAAGHGIRVPKRTKKRSVAGKWVHYWVHKLSRSVSRLTFELSVSEQNEYRK